MKVGIAGLGLIGGSLAKAYEKSGAAVYGYDGNRVVQDYAKLQGTLTGDLDRETIGDCDLLLVALYPQVSIDYLKEMAPYISKDTLVMDCCGVKREVCRVGFALAEKHGFTFVGGHPMAGTQYSGFANSKADLFQGAPMVVIPRERDDILLLDRVKKLLTPAGFSHMTVTTAEHHDAMIAYTSQMCHVQRLCKKPPGPDAQGILRRELPGSDPGGLAERDHVDRPVPGEPGLSAGGAGPDDRLSGRVPGRPGAGQRGPAVHPVG